MDNNFEKYLKDNLNKKKEMPSSIRDALNNTYNQLKKEKPKKNLWRKTAIVACVVLALGTTLSFDSVRANVKAFLGFNDTGIHEAIKNDFVNNTQASSIDKGINITLENFFADNNKSGLNFKLNFEDISLLKNLESCDLEFRLKDKNGNYMYEFISDTKILKNKNIISGIGYESKGILNKKENSFEYDIVLRDSNGNLKDLNNSTLEIETLHLFYKSNTKSIDGTWSIPIKWDKKITTKKYMQESSSNKIKILSAICENTSLNLQFEFKGNIDENIVLKTKLIDENNNIYSPDGLSLEENGDLNTIKANFPITTYNNSKKLKLIIEGIGETYLVPIE